MEFTERSNAFAPKLSDIDDVYGPEIGFDEFSRKPEGWVGIVETNEECRAVVIALRVPASGAVPSDRVTYVLKYVGAPGMHDGYSLSGPHAQACPYVNPDLVNDKTDYSWTVDTPSELDRIWELSFDAQAVAGKALQDDIEETGKVGPRTLAVLTALNSKLGEPDSAPTTPE